MNAMNRPLNGLKIGCSISISEDLDRYGLKPDDINTVTVDLCRRFVGLGAQVVLGHQWRPNGVMEAVARFAQAYHGESTEGHIIHNYMAWPDRAALSETDRTQLRPLVDIRELTDHQDDRAEALRAMREQVADLCDARICLAGKMYQKPEFVHGVIEEVALTLRLGRPVYMSKMMGGSTAVMIDVIRGRLDPDQARIRLNKGERAGNWERTQSYLQEIREFGASRLADACELGVDGLDALFDSHNLDTVVQLTSRGLMNSPIFKRR